MREAASNVIPAEQKTKFPPEFTVNTISLIHQKRRLWRYMQKSGVHVTRSLRDKYRSLCNKTKQAIKCNRNAIVEKEAAELTDAFNQDTFKREFRNRSKAVLPPEADFTAHYTTHYELGLETPATIDSFELPLCSTDDNLTHEDFDKGVQKLNANRSPGHDNIAPEFIKHDGGTVLLCWIFLLMHQIWTFCE